MNFFDKNRLTFWILIFLVVVNGSALVTYFFIGRSNTAKELPASADKPGIALQSELSLATGQDSIVKEINSAYKASTEPIIESIKEKKTILLEELSKPISDTNIINTILSELDFNQNKLQRENIKQFMALKKVCTPEQTQKLSQIYLELYGCNGKGKGKGNGQGMKYRHRYGLQGNK